MSRNTNCLYTVIYAKQCGSTSIWRGILASSVEEAVDKFTSRKGYEYAIIVNVMTEEEYLRRYKPIDQETLDSFMRTMQSREPFRSKYTSKNEKDSKPKKNKQKKKYSQFKYKYRMPNGQIIRW